MVGLFWVKKPLQRYVRGDGNCAVSGERRNLSPVGQKHEYFKKNCGEVLELTFE
jgi:hypothetical protein